MNQKLRFNPGISAYMGAILLWGVTFVISKSLLNEVGPFLMTFLRFFLAILVIYPFAHREGFRLSMMFQPVMLFLGFFGILLTYGLQNVALQYTSAGNAALIYASLPAVVALLSALILKEYLNWLRIFGILFSVIGVVLISLNDISSFGGRLLLGNSLMVGAVLSYAIYMVTSKKYVHELSPFSLTAGCFLAGLLFLIPAASIEVWNTGLPQISWPGFFSLLYLGLGASALATFLQLYGLSFIDASLAAVFLNLVPIVGLFAALIAGEKASVLQVFGGFIAIIGVLICNLGPQKENTKYTIG
ncbi:MAG: DMT family transporter [Anaerolineaceae bacterium]|nr:DMT family transporter [Anaerolineaceae bacterium]